MRKAAADFSGIFRPIRCRPRFWCRSSTGPKGLTVLLTQRASQLARHAAQISFPGGRLEPSDRRRGERRAARGAGGDRPRSRRAYSVFGYLPDHLVISGFRVTPVLSLVTPPFSLSSIPTEVAEVFEVP